MATGFDFGNHIENIESTTNKNTYIPPVGFNISGYGFEIRNITQV
jgi:hypothetical protein